MKTQLLPLYFLLLVGICNCTIFENCESTGGIVQSVEIEGCEGKDTCPLDRNGKASIQIKFQATSQVDSGRSIIAGKIANIFVPFQNQDACDGMGMGCPLVAGNNYTYQNTVALKSWYPPIKVPVKFRVRDTAAKSDVVCVVIPCVIV